MFSSIIRAAMLPLVTIATAAAAAAAAATSDAPKIIPALYTKQPPEVHRGDRELPALCPFDYSVRTVGTAKTAADNINRRNLVVAAAADDDDGDDGARIDGEITSVSSFPRRRLRRRRRRQQSAPRALFERIHKEASQASSPPFNDALPSPPPITIVRQGGSDVEFTINQNSTWFAADAAYDRNKDGTRAGVPVHIFASFATDEFGSERCVVSDGVGVAPSDEEVLKARCSKLGSISVVRVFARFFDDAENDEPSRNRGGGVVEVPKCCDDPYADKSSSFKVIEYVFQLKCTATCENPTEHSNSNINHHDNDGDDATNESSATTPSSARTMDQATTGAVVPPVDESTATTPASSPSLSSLLFAAPLVRTTRSSLKDDTVATAPTTTTATTRASQPARRSNAVDGDNNAADDGVATGDRSEEEGDAGTDAIATEGRPGDKGDNSVVSGSDDGDGDVIYAGGDDDVGVGGGNDGEHKGGEYSVLKKFGMGAMVISVLYCSVFVLSAAKGRPMMMPLRG